MKLTGSKVAMVGAVCGVGMLASLVAQAQQAPAPAAGAQVQAPAAGAPAGQGRGGGRGAGRQGGGGGGGRGGPQTQVADVTDVAQMLAALPATAPATPAQPRRVLVLARAAGFVHSSIPLAARTIEALGNKTGAWNTVITFNPADINTQNLAGYDAIFLASTTGAFLDDANDAAATAARRAALLEFVRGGKGLAGIHAATDTYNQGGTGTWPEFNKLIGGSFKWHWNWPTTIVMKVEDVENPINAAFTSAGRGGGARGPASTAALTVMDEIYTFSMSSWNRKNVRVLTSIDYAKMPAEVKAQEPANGKRTDGDYALSYIQKEGNGRVFVQVLGHHESIYKQRPHLEHMLAGMQYAIGDLKADDTPKP